MDSLTQIALGAATCGIVARHPLRRAMLYGAALGTLPDLDVLLLGHLDPVEQFVRHRGFSHSLLVLSALAPPLAWLLRRLDSGLRQKVGSGRWTLAVWLALVTHALLDAFTVYGTQLWWPLPLAPSAWASVFIIDPLYTLPLAIALVLAWRRPDPVRAGRALAVGLLLAQGYLAWGLLAKHYVERQVAQILAARGQSASAVLVSPAPFTSLLWRVLVRTPEGHSEGWYSLLRRDDAQFAPQPVAFDAALRATLPPLAAVDTLRWFSHDYLRFEAVDGRLQVADLRMGVAPEFFFVFELAEQGPDGWRPIVPRRVESARPRTERMREVYGRL